MGNRHRHKTFIVIPAHNEEKSIVGVVNGLRRAGYRNIVVVDDGSSDRTASVAKKAGTIVLKHIINRGQGAALRTGVEHSLSNGAEIIVHFDADGQHDVNDLKDLISPVAIGKFDVALGSRFLKKASNAPFAKKVMLKGGALLLRVMYGIKLTDSHNGLRAFSRKAAQQVDITTDEMEHASEIPEKIAKKKLRYVEVPVKIKYTRYSAMDGQTSWAAFKIFFKMMVRKFAR